MASTFKYPLIALSLTLFINGMLLLAELAGEQSPIPILMQLLLSELGFIISLAGIYYGGKTLVSQFHLATMLLTLGCAAFGMILAYKGYILWQSLSLQV